jgi:hypothetical protein
MVKRATLNRYIVVRFYAGLLHYKSLGRSPIGGGRRLLTVSAFGDVLVGSTPTLSEIEIITHLCL